MKNWKKAIAVTAILFIVIVWGSVNYFFNSPCGVHKVNVILKQIDEINNELADMVIIAKNTPSSDLADPIKDIMRIRREIEALTVPDCLTKAKKIYIYAMDHLIDALLALKTQKDFSIAEENWEISYLYFEYYFFETIEVRKCAPFCD